MRSRKRRFAHPCQPPHRRHPLCLACDLLGALAPPSTIRLLIRRLCFCLCFCVSSTVFFLYLRSEAFSHCTDIVHFCTRSEWTTFCGIPRSRKLQSQHGLRFYLRRSDDFQGQKRDAHHCLFDLRLWRHRIRIMLLQPSLHPASST